MSQKLPDDSAKNELLKKSRKINKLNLKIKNGCSSKDTVKKKKNQPRLVELFAKHAQQMTCN